MFSAPFSYWFCEEGDRRFICINLFWLVLMVVQILIARVWYRVVKLSQLHRECALDCLGISCQQLVFEGKGSKRPTGKSLGIA